MIFTLLLDFFLNKFFGISSNELNSKSFRANCKCFEFIFLQHERMKTREEIICIHLEIKEN